MMKFGERERGSRIVIDFKRNITTSATMNVAVGFLSLHAQQP
jgi:hypothetical protein